MARIIILGSSAEFPLPRTKTNNFKDYLDIASYQRKFKLHDDPLCNNAKTNGRANKNRRIRSSVALTISGKVLLFDAGPDIKYQLKKYRLKPDATFITHSHPDADYGLRYLDLKKVKVFSEKVGNIKHGEIINVFGVKILPFRVRHSKVAPYTGYKIQLPTANYKLQTIVYITDMSSVAGIKEYVKDADIMFADGSILKRNLFGHLSITNQLKIYKKWGLKRVIFTHIGHNTLPYENLVKYVRGRYRHAEVAYDGMVIRV